MLGGDDFYGPWQYPLWVLWLVLGLLLVALVLGWAWFVRRVAGRSLPAGERERLLRSTVDPDEVRRRYERLIDEVEAASAEGSLSDRGVHSRLSLLVRFHAHELGGGDAHVMTLEDLRAADLPQVTGAVERWYPPAFRPEHPADPREAVARAREVVRSWR